MTEIHKLVLANDLSGIRRAIALGVEVDSLDANGYTPLMIAVCSEEVPIEIVECLLAAGADANARVFQAAERSRKSVLQLAVSGNSLGKVERLLLNGADVRFVDNHGYGIVLATVYGGLRYSEQLSLPLLRRIIATGSPLDQQSSYGESALSVASHHAHFETVRILLEAGADPAPLGWSPVFHAACFGSIDEIDSLLSAGERLDGRDRSERTPFLLSVHAGRLDVAKHLLALGSDRAARGRCGHTALMYAIDRDDGPMLRWLVSQGWNVEEADEFDDFPLALAVQRSAVVCTETLLNLGASATREDRFGHGILESASSREIIRLLNATGEDLSDVRSTNRVTLLGTRQFPWEVPEPLYVRHKHRAFGKMNGEQMNNAYWDAMVRERCSAYQAAARYDGARCDRDAVWCCNRFGQSLTELADGRFVEIGGEHEDHYDPDFCIYNDVIVHHRDGTFQIFGYPEECFPPTDFHSATLVEPYIYIIGSLGYPQQRSPGVTPVYRLDCRTWKIEPVRTVGTPPGWIYQHRAKLISNASIQVTRGKILDPISNDFQENTSAHELRLSDHCWLVCDQS